MESRPKLSRQEFLARLHSYGLRPAHALGQNFLWDKDLLQSIVEGAALLPLDRVLEIGSGAGTLTEVLAERAKRVVSVEIDQHLQPILNDLADKHPNLEFIFEDARKLRFDELFSADEKRNLQIVANLPYYLTSELIKQCLCQLPQARRMIFLVQKDAVPRLKGAAGDGKSESKNQGWLAKLIACYGEVKILKTLPAACFYPEPHVDSQLIYLERSQGSSALAMLESHPDRLSRVIEVAFYQRRKSMVNCFAASGLKEQVRAWLLERNLPATLRAEQLSPEDFADLTSNLYL